MISFGLLSGAWRRRFKWDAYSRGLWGSSDHVAHFCQPTELVQYGAVSMLVLPHTFYLLFCVILFLFCCCLLQVLQTCFTASSFLSKIESQRKLNNVMTVVLPMLL